MSRLPGRPGVLATASLVITLLLFGSALARVPLVSDSRPVAFIWAVDMQNPADKRALGSGFLLDKSGRVVTAKHVVEARVGGEALAVSLGSKSDFPVPVDDSDIRCAPDAPDVCFVRIPQDVVAGKAITAFFKVGCYLPEPGDELLGVGFPGGANPFVQLQQIPGTVTGGQISQSLIPTNIALQSGMSGGPVFDATGTVIGVVKGADQSNPTFTFVTPLQGAASTFLNVGVQCPFERAEPGSGDSGALSIFGEKLAGSFVTDEGFPSLRTTEDKIDDEEVVAEILNRTVTAISSIRYHPFLTANIGVGSDGFLSVRFATPDGLPAEIGEGRFNLTKFGGQTSAAAVLDAFASADVPPMTQTVLTPFNVLDATEVSLTTRLRRRGAYGLNFSLPGYEFTWTVCEYTQAGKFNCLDQNGEPITLSDGKGGLSLRIPFVGGRSEVAVCAKDSGDQALAAALANRLSQLGGSVAAGATTAAGRTLHFISGQPSCEWEVNFSAAKTDPTYQLIQYRISLIRA